MNILIEQEIEDIDEMAVADMKEDEIYNRIKCALEP